ncbi:cuticle protein 16.5-like [Leptopilina boulardi]|uniref:cuticle protein 16.5-like n=1 Tax=Leptopilina boulardi TaxID=63433 RepID=UPI0021F63E9E|nr:cuticle protein 16.5-like [Leptopilina boulardi]
MLSFIAIFSLVAAASASVLPAAPLVAGPAVSPFTAPLVAAPAIAPFSAPLAAPIVTARSSQLVARNYNTFATPVGYVANAAISAPGAYVSSPIVAPASYAAPAAYLSPAVAPYSSPVIGAPLPAAPASYFFRR